MKSKFPYIIFRNIVWFFISGLFLKFWVSKIISPSCNGDNNTDTNLKYHLPRHLHSYNKPLSPLSLSRSLQLHQFHNGEIQQQPGGFSKPPNPASLHSRSRRRDLAESPRLDRLREVSPKAGDRSRRIPAAGVSCGTRWRVLPPVVPPLGLPTRHVRPHPPPLLFHHLRLRRHQQGRRPGRLWSRVSVCCF